RVGFALHEEGRAHQADPASLRAYLAFEDARRWRIVREQRRGNAGLGILLDEIRRLDCRDRHDDEIWLGSRNAGDGRIPVRVVAILRDVENDLLAGLLYSATMFLRNERPKSLFSTMIATDWNLKSFFKQRRLA